MSNELRATYQAGQTLFAATYNATAQVWRPSTQVFEDFGAYGRTMADYDIAITQVGSAGGYYLGDFDSNIPAGYYLVVYYVQLGSSPGNTDAPVQFDYGYWTGAEWLSVLDMVSGKGDTLCTITIRTTAGVIVPNVLVWLNVENDETETIVVPRTTDSNGQVQFYLNYETYYVFCQHASYTFAAATITPSATTNTFTLDIASWIDIGGGEVPGDPVLEQNHTYTEFVTRIKELCGRATANVTIDIEGIIVDALNDALRRIIRRCPNIAELQISDTTTLSTVADEYQVSLLTLNPRPAHVQDVWLLNGASTVRVWHLPLKEFDRRYPAISAISSGRPKYFTVRRWTMEFSCPIGSDYASLYIRINYCRWPSWFTTSAVARRSPIVGADQGLIYYGWSELLRGLSKTNPELMGGANDKMGMFEDWLTKFGDYHDMQTEELAGEMPRSLVYEDD